ncbi:hypothetical protein BaRGS_00028124 [Batillaria attramentaria]|uniref:Uncharacterized protein n=1 Tax=Batillaria attramentaria TaxID=370345 RepID=A0ABD0K030_9CAEN
MRTFSVLLLTLNLPLVALLGGREAVWVGGRKDATDRIAATDEPVVFALQAINDWYADSSTGTSKLPRRLMKIVKAETQASVFET